MPLAESLNCACSERRTPIGRTGDERSIIARSRNRIRIKGIFLNIDAFDQFRIKGIFLNIDAFDQCNNRLILRRPESRFEGSAQPDCISLDL